MNQRQLETPLFLWICAALCAHFLLAGGGGEVAELHEDRSFLFHMGARARGAAGTRDQTIEIQTSEEGKPVEPPPMPAQPEPPKPKPPEPKKTAQPPPSPEPKPPPPEPLRVEVKPKDPAKQLDEVPLRQDNRIAVRQHAPKQQPENPNAKFIADEANKVEEETVATQTSHDQDDPNPTPGANRTAGPRERVGDSERTKIAESDEHKGEKDRAPGEKGTEFDVQTEARPIEKVQSAQKSPAQAEPSAALPRAGGDARPMAQVQPSTQRPELVPGTPPGPSPDTSASDKGSFSFSPFRPGAELDPRAASPGTTQQRPAPNTSVIGSLGLGAAAAPGQINLNLSHQGVVAAVGADQLRKERQADGERRKSEHRGSWLASSFERWRNSIENYVTSVKPGNQTALNTAAVPFATYLTTIHNRIHPIFADSFLGSLGSLPNSHPMNDPRIVTRLEIVVSPDQGRVVKMGVVKTSGITAFDIAALDSVQRAQPFGPAPKQIISADGNVYLHWEFHRDEVYACSTMHARPFLLNTPPKPPESEPPGGPSPSRPSLERHGAVPKRRHRT